MPEGNGGAVAKVSGATVIVRDNIGWEWPNIHKLGKRHVVRKDRVRVARHDSCVNDGQGVTC